MKNIANIKGGWIKIAVQYIDSIEKLTQESLMIFLTEWEINFLSEIDFKQSFGKRISLGERKKIFEIERKLQDIKNDLIQKNTTAPNKVVEKEIKPRSIILSYFIWLKSTDIRFTILTDSQKLAIKKIKDYWISRTRNYKNWKSQKHWNYRKETISSRIDDKLFEKLKNNNNNKSIKNFIRKFLRDSNFRKLFFDKLEEQYQKDPVLVSLNCLDITDGKTALIELFPHVVSSEILTIEKELFTFYFTFIEDFSVSYAIRIGLMHFRDLYKQHPIKEKEEVIQILINLLEPERDLLRIKEEVTD